MTEILKATQQQQRHEIADVEAVGGRVETAIQGDRACLEPGPERSVVGGVLDQAASRQVVEDRGTLVRLLIVPTIRGVPWFMDTFAAD